MQTIILVIHMVIAVFLVAVILLQRSEGGALGMGGGSAMGGLVSSRGAANLLTRLTTVLAATFIVTSLVLSIISSRNTEQGSVLDSIQKESTDAPVLPELNLPNVPTIP